MLKRIVLMVGIALHPIGAQAAACKLEQATFRPRFSAEHFVLRSARDGADLRFEITVRRTGEIFPFRVQVDGRTGDGTITSIPNGTGQNPGVRSTFKLYDAEGLNTSPAGEISHLSFYDLGRAFVDFRMRGSRNVEPYTSPPSGLWSVTDCRPN